jgi:hypothetical protein
MFMFKGLMRFSMHLLPTSVRCNDCLKIVHAACSLHPTPESSSA